MYVLCCWSTSKNTITNSFKPTFLEAIWQSTVQLHEGSWGASKDLDLIIVSFARQHRLYSDPWSRWIAYNAIISMVLYFLYNSIMVVVRDSDASPLFQNVTNRESIVSPNCVVDDRIQYAFVYWIYLVSIHISVTKHDYSILDTLSTHLNFFLVIIHSFFNGTSRYLSNLFESVSLAF